jgi:hypothetical protein
MAAPTTRGSLDSCPCPHCAYKLDFTDVPILDVGTTLSCDSCKKFFEIKGTKKMTVITIAATDRPTPARGLIKR